jgi:hypothetical protein
MAWVYRTVHARWGEVDTVFNQLAAEDWELVHVSTHAVPEIVGIDRKYRAEYLQTWAIFRKEGDGSYVASRRPQPHQENAEELSSPDATTVTTDVQNA